MDDRSLVERAYRLDRSLESVTEARHALRELVVECCPGLMMHAELLLTEIVTNAIKYQRARDGWIAFSYRWSAPRLLIDVYNPGEPFAFERPTLPLTEAVELDEDDASTGEALVDVPESGRGLWLVDSLASDWGIDDVEPPSRAFDVSERRVCHVWFSCEDSDRSIDLFAADIAAML